MRRVITDDDSSTRVFSRAVSKFWKSWQSWPGGVRGRADWSGCTEHVKRAWRAGDFTRGFTELGGCVRVSREKFLTVKSVAFGPSSRQLRAVGEVVPVPVDDREFSQCF